MPTPNILIVAGEPSGDIHAAQLVRELHALNPSLSFFGIGGTLSAQAGVEITADITSLAIVGVAEVFQHWSVINRAHHDVLAQVEARRPSAAILVDYPGFNLRLARELHRRSIPVIYYVSPQVWAWGKGRIALIKKYVRTMVVFFKFEEDLYRKAGIDATWVGHPLVDRVHPTATREATLLRWGLDPSKKMVALLPGSRTIEIKKLMALLAATAKRVRTTAAQTQFVVAKHKDLPRELYDAAVGLTIADGDTYNVLAAADCAIVASGTATLETALIGTPFCLVYRTHPATALAYFLVRRIPYLGLVNVIAGKEIAPEFLQWRASPDALAQQTVRMLTDTAYCTDMRREFDAVKKALGAGGAAARAARTILPLLT